MEKLIPPLERGFISRIHQSFPLTVTIRGRLGVAFLVGTPVQILIQQEVMVAIFILVKPSFYRDLTETSYHCSLSKTFYVPVSGGDYTPFVHLQDASQETFRPPFSISK